MHTSPSRHERDSNRHMPQTCRVSHAPDTTHDSTTDTMAIMDDSYERDMMKIWTLVVDLSEQLSHTKQQADALRSHSMILKVCVILKNQTLPQFLTALVYQSGSSSAFRDGVCSETVLLRACSPRLVLTRLCYQGLIFICHKVRLCSLTMRILLRTTYRRI